MSETITKYYSLGSALMQYGQVNGETNPNATTMQAMQAYMKQNGDTLGNVVDSFLWQPETDYVVDAEVHSPNLPAGYIARCTTAGKTGTIEPEWSTSYSTYTDGTVTWSIVSQKEQIATKVDKTNPQDSAGKALATQEYVDSKTDFSSFGTKVDIKSYTDGVNCYTAPSDGYVMALGSGSVLNLNAAGVADCTYRSCAFVKKGMKIWFEYATPAWAYFVPFISS